MPDLDLGLVVGPQGPKGDDGAAGPQGPKGDDGAPGPNSISSSTATNITGLLAGDGSHVTAATLDSFPTANSGNPVTSGGVRSAYLPITKAEYDLLDPPDPNVIYFIYDDQGGDASAYSQAQTDALLAMKAPMVGKGINLLDNWYFPNAINQRNGYVVPPGINYYVSGSATPVGQTSTYITVKSFANNVGYIDIGGTEYVVTASDCVRGYTGEKYGIDRWFAWYGGDVVVYTDGISIPDENDGWLAQWLENYDSLVGKDCTLSILDALGRLYAHTFTVPSTGFSGYDGELYKVQIGVAGGSSKGVIISSVHGSTKSHVVAVKLELGSQQTLARNIGTEANPQWVLNDPAPNYQQELAKCQRYLLVLGGVSPYGPIGSGVSWGTNGFSVIVPTPTTMATIKSVSQTGFSVRFPNGTYHAASLLSAYNASQNSILVDFGTSDSGVSFTVGSVYVVMANNNLNAKMIISAEL